MPSLFPPPGATVWPKGPEEHTFIGYMFALNIVEHLTSTGELITRQTIDSTLFLISNGTLTLSEPEPADDINRKLALERIPNDQETAQMIRRAFAHVFDAQHKVKPPEVKPPDSEG